MTSYTLNLRGRLYPLDEPKIMGILNVTPDSFYAPSRTLAEEEMEVRVRRMLAEGADMIDVGACSSRPGAADVTPEVEMERLRRGVRCVRRLAPDIPLSVDTFRADVACMAVEEEGADMVNDISGGLLDRRMFRMMARLGVPYVLMHMRGTPETMQRAPHYDDVRREVMLFFAQQLERLHRLGTKDVIVDPGFGFGKTIDHNYELMAHLEDFRELDRPLLVGVSRKSMVYRLLDGTPQTALNGTTALHAFALLKGAHILRVHDVKEAVEVKKVYLKMRGCD